MKFKVGPWVYRVKISADPIYDEDGGEAAGLCVWRRREILLSDQMPAENRLETLLHELRHAWLNHFGRPDSVEGECDSVASFAIDTIGQLAQQGGEAALIRQGSD